MVVCARPPHELLTQTDHTTTHNPTPTLLLFKVTDQTILEADRSFVWMNNEKVAKASADTFVAAVL